MRIWQRFWNDNEMTLVAGGGLMPAAAGVVLLLIAGFFA